MSTENDKTAYPEGTIPVNDAIKLAANWRVYLENSKSEFTTKSFLVPIATFKNILLYNPDAEGVRVYIGLESETDPTSAKLVLVPVVDGEDVPFLVFDKNAGDNGDGSIGAPDGQSNTYDLTKACPPTCGSGCMNE